MVRPERELAGFARVSLRPGETKHVTFRVSPSQIAYLNREMRWMVEQGEMDVMIGASCEDIRYEETIKITDTRYMEGPDRVFYCMGEVTA